MCEISLWVIIDSTSTEYCSAENSVFLIWDLSPYIGPCHQGSPQQPFIFIYLPKALNFISLACTYSPGVCQWTDICYRTSGPELLPGRIMPQTQENCSQALVLHKNCSSSCTDCLLFELWILVNMRTQMQFCKRHFDWKLNFGFMWFSIISLRQNLACFFLYFWPNLGFCSDSSKALCIPVRSVF